MVSREKRFYHILLPLITLLVALFLVFYLFYLTVVKGENQNPYDNPKVATRVVRGTITDRNGKILAIERPYYQLVFLLNSVKDIEQAASLVSPIIKISTQQIVENSKKFSSYYLVKKELTQSEFEQLSKLKIEGLLLEKKYGRYYPQHYHATHIIGFTNSENRGLEGLEYLYDDLLYPIPRLDESVTYGNNITLTLDLDLQYLLDQQVVAIDQQHITDAIAAIILDAQTSEILASSSFPWYDLNNYGSATEQQRVNRVFSSMYEPGSVFKIYSLASELENNENLENFYCDGSYTFTTPSNQNVTINCVSAHGEIDPQKMLAVSCNGAVAHWALQTDNQQFYQTLKDFGFGQRLGKDLVGLTKGSLRELENWSFRSKPTISFGQEIGITFLQIANAATVFTTGGSLMESYIVKEVKDPSGKVIIQNSPTVLKERVISPSVVLTVIEGMIDATKNEGTAIHSSVAGVTVAAKTGTAQIASSSGGYAPGEFLASTIAIVPAENPKYIIYMGAINPSGTTIWGSNITAPAIGALIEDMVRQGKLYSTVSEHINLSLDSD
jgi:cell division protein FtsI (penicillin-binding protein 3)